MHQHNIATLHVTEISQSLLEHFGEKFVWLGRTRNHTADSPDLARLLSGGAAR